MPSSRCRMALLSVLLLALTLDAEPQVSQTSEHGFALTTTGLEAARAHGAAGFELWSATRQSSIFTDGFESGDTSAWQPALPSGAVVSLNSQSCPPGWTVYSTGRGRTIVGRPGGGTVGGTSGTVMADLEERSHKHDHEFFSVTAPPSPSDTHSHVWSYFNDSTNAWTSWENSMTTAFLMDWGDGMNNGGSGHYPFSVQDYPPVDEFWTNRVSTDHTHAVADTLVSSSSSAATLPFTQLLLCRKD